MVRATLAEIAALGMRNTAALRRVRDASLEGGRTCGEIVGEIATAMSDARLLRDRLMEADRPVP